MEERRMPYRIAAVGALMALRTVTLAAAEPNSILASARAAAGIADRSYAGFIMESGSERASGLSGRWSTVVDLATGKTRSTSNFGIFSTAVVWNGHSYWRQDASGGVHLIDSDFMRAVHVTDAWLTQFGYLRRDALAQCWNRWRIEQRTGGVSRSFALRRDKGNPLNCGSTRIPNDSREPCRK